MANISGASVVWWFVWFTMSIWETKGWGIWQVVQMTHSVSSSWNTVWQNKVCCLGWFAFSFTHFSCMFNVCLYGFVLVSFVYVHEVSKCCTHAYLMWCVLQTGLTFSCFKLTLTGFGGWQCCGQTEVICRSDPLSQLWDGSTELTGLCYPGPYLVFGFPPSLFFLHTWHYMISVPLHSVR